MGKRKNAVFRKTLLFIVLISVGLSPLFAVATQAPAAGDISFSIRYFDRRIYYLDQDPIFIQITLTNNSPAPFRFKLADERAFSVDFDVRTASNRAVEQADLLIRKRSQSQHVFFREISVETGESFSFVEDLRDFAALTQSGTYVVQARIFPELFPRFETNRQTLNQALESNRLILSLRHRPLLGPDGIPLELDVDTNAVLVRERLPPDEVVKYLLTARQRSQWEKFFLYLDLEAMLSRDAFRRRQFNAESEEGRRRMLARYRQDLQSAVVDLDISLIPMDFIIERTVYTAHTGTVTVLAFFRVGNYTERKRYTWYLERKNDIWMIVDYSVINLGTE
jgi:hypothetical protein